MNGDDNIDRVDHSVANDGDDGDDVECDGHNVYDSNGDDRQ